MTVDYYDVDGCFLRQLQWGERKQLYDEFAVTLFRVLFLCLMLVRLCAGFGGHGESADRSAALSFISSFYGEWWP